METKNLKVKVSGVDLIYTGVNKIAVSDSDDNVVYLYAIDDTTALASDVISGKYFYAADGTYTLGTASSGGGSSEPTLSTPIATISQVLAGYNFNDNSGTAKVGTMADNGAISQTLYVGNLSYTVPSGYHNGSGSVSVSIQTKTGTPTTSSQLISPDSGKLLSGVTIAAISVQSKTVKSTTSSQTISPDSGYYINSITVSPISLQSKTTTVNGTISPDSGYDGLSSVIVNVPSTGTDISDTTLIASKASAGYYFYLADGTKTQGTATDRSGFYSALTLGTNYPDSSLFSVSIPEGIYPSGKSGYVSYSGLATLLGITASEITSGNTILGISGTAVELAGETRSVTANGTYTPSSGKNGITSITVSVASTGTDVGATTAVAADVLASKIFYLANGTQATGTIISYGATTFLGSCTNSQNGLSVKIPHTGYWTTNDSNFILYNSSIATAGGVTADKIVNGNTLFGVTGTAVIANLTTKTITSNGTYTPAAPYNGFSEFTVDVAQTGTNVSDTTLTAPNARAGYYFYLADGTKTAGTMADNGAISQTLYVGNLSYTIPSGYHNGSGSVSVSIQTKTGTPTTSSQLISPDSGKLLSGVTIAAISVQSKTVKSTTSSQTISPDSGYYINSITVSPISLQSKTTTVNGTISPDSGYDGLSSVIVNVPSTGTDISDTTLTAPNALPGYYFYLADGTKTAGTMVDYTGLSVAGTMGYVTGSNYAISIDSSGYYAAASSSVYISQSEIAADVGLTAAKLVTGNTVLGVTGTATGGGGNYQSKSVTYTSNGTAKVTPDAGYDALSEVNVTVDVSGGGGVETCTLTLIVDSEPGGNNDACVYATTPDGAQTYSVAGTYTILKNSVLVAYYQTSSSGSYQLLPYSENLVLYIATGNLTISLAKGF